MERLVVVTTTAFVVAVGCERGLVCLVGRRFSYTSSSSFIVDGEKGHLRSDWIGTSTIHVIIQKPFLSLISTALSSKHTSLYHFVSISRTLIGALSFFKPIFLARQASHTHRRDNEQKKKDTTTDPNDREQHCCSYHCNTHKKFSNSRTRVERL